MNSTTSKITIIDNFLDQEKFAQLQNLVMGANFYWELGDEKVPWGGHQPELGEWQDQRELIEKYNYQLTHSLYDRGVDGIKSPCYKDFSCFLQNINMFSLVRLRATLNHRTENPLLLGGYHTDLDPIYRDLNVYTGVYYFNSNNGYTSFLSGEKVESVANRFVCFPCDMLHSAVSCTDQKYRIQLNINFIKDLKKKSEK